MYSRRNPPELPPCLTCRVELLPENRDIAAVFGVVRNQVVTIGDGRPVDLNIQAVKTVMDMRAITDQKTCLERVLRLWHHVEAEKRRHAS
jgi:hypothetical protein